jgi:hypothetical protein
MNNFIMVKGSEIYAAAIEGAKRGYNRTTDNCARYEEKLQFEFDSLFNYTNDEALKKRVLNNTKGNWRNAYLPLHFLMYHSFIKMRESEQHVRVMLNESKEIFDITMEDWERLVSKSVF